MDYASLGEAQVRALLDSNNSHWTPHQQFLARKWLAELDINESADTAKVGRVSLSVMRITLWVAIVALIVAVLTWFATN